MVTNATLEGNTPLDCPKYSLEALIAYDAFLFWCEGIAGSTISVLGIVGNIITAFILSRSGMRNNFNWLLASLAVYDTTYLMAAFIDNFRWQFHLVSYTHMIFPYFLHPLQSTAMTGSILMMLGIAWERVLVTHYHRNVNLKWCLALVFIISVLINVHKFFETRLLFDSNEAITWLQVTELRTDPISSIVTNWMLAIVIGFIPFILLILLNIQVYIDTTKSREAASSPSTARQKHDTHLASIMVVYVTVFLLSHFFCITLNIHELATFGFVRKCLRGGQNGFPLWAFYVAAISHLMLAVKSSANLIIYAAMSPKFRNEMRVTFRSLCSNKSVTNSSLPNTEDGTEMVTFNC